MKKLFVLSALAAGLFACGGGETKTEPAETPETVAPAKDDISQNPDYQKGLALISQSDCLTCHKVDETATGPSYRDVANKYPSNEATLDTLADKIIKGGQGNWGQVPMTGHPDLSVEDAKQMVKYVMLLKNN